MIAALTSRALAEKVDRSVVIRRCIRIGAAAEGIDVTGLGCFAPAGAGQ
ncbi:hypothetical protein [Synechococcus sp. CCAP 1479/9]|nr:hypothetical protein [Synechococcus sp. CCAP 1479/9]